MVGEMTQEVVYSSAITCMADPEPVIERHNALARETVAWHPLA
jgi:hypothetical protein